MIPFSLKLRIIFSKMFWTMLCLMAALFFTGKFFTDKDWYAHFMLDENAPVTEGVIAQKWVETYHENDEGNEYFLYGYEYTFQSPAGEQLRWTSYSEDSSYQAGDKIQIQYSEKEPRVNRAVGMRNETTKSIDYLILAAVLLIIATILNLIFGHFKMIRVLNNGRLAIGNKFDKVSTNSTVNDQRVYKVYFKFKTLEGEEVSTFVRTHKTKKIEDQKNELLIYHAHHPKKIIMVDMLPKAARKFLYKEYERVSGKKLRRKVI